MTFIDQLNAAWQKNNSLLCVGLDPDPAKFPAHLKGRDDAIFEFCAAIVDATADLVCSFKPQIAYFAARRVRKFDESNWWQWGRHFPINELPRIYVNGRTRRPEPFFLHDCHAFDGSILALFTNNRRMQRRDLIDCTMMLNKEVDWQQLGFVCDGRFIFTQRSLQTCLLPDKFSRYLPKDSA